MLRVLGFFLLFSLSNPSPTGRTLRIRVGDLSFLVTEPQGWTIDRVSAAQLAHFIAHRQGVSWREAEAVVFGRVVEKQESQDLGSFLTLQLEQYQQGCPLFEEEQIPDESGDWDPRFTRHAFYCPGRKYEVVALTEFPTHFALFILSTSEREVIRSSLPAFRKLLASVHWETRAFPSLTGRPDGGRD